MNGATKPYYATARKQFESETTEHKLTILRDDGLYRHLRCAKPGTGMWSWEIITWPGYLTIVGDVGDGYVFRREPDMFTWFGYESEPYRINPGYWSEKVPHTIRTQRFSEEAFRERVREAAREHAAETFAEDSTGRADRARFFAEIEYMLADTPEDDALAHTNVQEFTFDGERVFEDTWEWDFRDWDHHFLLACFAICWAIHEYKLTKAAGVTTDGVSA